MSGPKAPDEGEPKNVDDLPNGQDTEVVNGQRFHFLHMEQLHLCHGLHILSRLSAWSASIIADSTEGRLS